MTLDDVVGYGAAGAAAVWLLKLLRSLVLKIDRLDRIASKELEHNHGSSIKDDVHGIAIAIGTLQRDHDELRRQFVQHIKERKQA